MALLYNNIQATPQTHVLLIGVGGYPYLEGGSQPLLQEDDLSRLGQLTSPQTSVEAFYKAILEFEEHKWWIKPLGSVELLLSPVPGATWGLSGDAPTPATMQNIDAAYFAWKERCDTHEDNVALFYFCGHGLGKGEHYLLAEDFGKNPRNPWTGAFNFDLTRTAFHSCKAKTQLFFVDACRQVTTGMLVHNLSIPALDHASYLGSECTYNLTLKASAANESAYGRNNSPSFFTQALLIGLKGLAASNQHDDWTVSTGALSSGINQFLRLVEPTQGFPQRCQSIIGDVTDILRLPRPPKVKLSVYCDPDEANPFAALTYTHLETGVSGQREQPASSPWDIELEAGIYELEAKFENPPYIGNKIKKSAVPPMPTVKIKCL